MNEKPFFSIVTVCRNAGSALIETVGGVLSQSFGDFEIIVKDGASDDGSLERLTAELPDERIRCFSAPDGGIYDAMNVAVGLTRGKYLIFLNCGDRLADENVLKDAHTALKDACGSELLIAYGDCIYDGIRRTQPKHITSAYLYRRPLNHQTMFFGREIFEKCGSYRVELKVRADHALALEAFRAGVRFLKIDRVISVYEQGGFSESAANREQRINDLSKIREMYFSPAERKRYEFRAKLGMRGLRNKLAAKSSPRVIRRLYAKLADLFNGR